MTTVTIEPESELADALRSAATTGDAIFVRVGKTSYAINIERESPPTDVSHPTPEEVEVSRAATRAAAGSWKGIVDAEELKAYIRERRLAPSRGDQSL